MTKKQREALQAFHRAVSAFDNATRMKREWERRQYHARKSMLEAYHAAFGTGGPLQKALDIPDPDGV